VHLLRLEPLEDGGGAQAVDVALLEDGDGLGRLEAVAGTHVLECVEELGVALVRLVAELVARESKDGELVAILGSEGIHCGEFLHGRASQGCDVNDERRFALKRVKLDRGAINLVGREVVQARHRKQMMDG
jgi:hypothetical protein